jgi:acyl carrier protein
MSTLDDAARLVARALDIQAEIGPHESIATLPAWTSLGHVRVVLELEEALGRSLATEEVVGIDSVAAVAALLATASR